MRFILLILCYLALSGCDDFLGSFWSPTDETIYLDSYREPCENSSGVDVMCYRYRRNEGDDWQTLAINIEGFTTYAWGQTHTIVVREQKTDDFGKEWTWSYLSTESSSTVKGGLSFDIQTSGSSGLLYRNTTGDAPYDFSLGGEASISCLATEDATNCSSLESLVATGAQILLNLKFNTLPNEALLFNASPCGSTDDDDFSESCQKTKKNVTIYLQNFLSSCSAIDASAGMCLIASKSEDKDFKLFVEADKIQDFTFLWGHSYELLIDINDYGTDDVTYTWVKTVRDTYFVDQYKEDNVIPGNFYFNYSYGSSFYLTLLNDPNYFKVEGLNDAGEIQPYYIYSLYAKTIESEASAYKNYLYCLFEYSSPSTENKCELFDNTVGNSEGKKLMFIEAKHAIQGDNLDRDPNTNEPSPLEDFSEEYLGIHIINTPCESEQPQHTFAAAKDEFHNTTCSTSDFITEINLFEFLEL